MDAREEHPSNMYPMLVSPEIFPETLSSFSTDVNDSLISSNTQPVSPGAMLVCSPMSSRFLSPAGGDGWSEYTRALVSRFL
jgi:hypothetical protein